MTLHVLNLGCPVCFVALWLLQYTTFLCLSYTHMYTLDQNEEALDELLDIIQVRHMSTILVNGKS